MADKRITGTWRIHVGTSGWHYRHWVGSFYPAGTRPPDFLDLYLRHFRTVEINNSFYHLPATETLEAWRDAVPRDFRFAVKASRFITHNKKLKDGQGSFRLFFDRVKVLGTRLGPILFQLPPQWKFNGERLEEFLASLPRGPRYAFEFRNEGWLREESYALLERYGAAFCQYDWNGYRTPEKVIGKQVYVRFHGPREGYGGSYSRPALKTWAQRMRGWAEEGREVWCYFNNDAQGGAPGNAETLMELLGG